MDTCNKYLSGGRGEGNRFVIMDPSYGREFTIDNTTSRTSYDEFIKNGATITLKNNAIDRFLSGCRGGVGGVNTVDDNIGNKWTITRVVKKKAAFYPN
jgi:hypothetical protein